jgi:hypothetical protein
MTVIQQAFLVKQAGTHEHKNAAGKIDYHRHISKALGSANGGFTSGRERNY